MPYKDDSGKTAPKVLLLHPGQEVALTNDTSTEVPLGLLMLGGALLEAGYCAEVFDFQIETDPSKFYDRLDDPDVLAAGITATTIQIYRAAKIASAIKTKRPEVLTVVGGFHTSALPERTIELFPQIDIAVTSEGETSLVNILEAARSDQNFEQIPGLCIRKDGRPFLTDQNQHLPSLEDWPLPARELVSPDLYSGDFAAYKGRPESVAITSKGCAFKCKFCSCHTLFRHKLRFFDTEWIIEDFRKMKKQGVRSVRIIDDTLNVPQDRLYKLCKALAKEDFGFAWSCYARADFMDQKLAATMKKAGCFHIRFGFEVGSAKQMERIGKPPAMFEKAPEVVKLCRKEGIHVHSNFIMALPGESEDDSHRTIEFARKLALDSFSFSTFYPFPGSPYFDMLLESGDLYIYTQGAVYNKFDLLKLCPEGTDKNVDKRQLEEYRKKSHALFKRAFFRCLFNPGWISRQIHRLFTDFSGQSRFLYNGFRRLFVSLLFRGRVKPDLLQKITDRGTR